MNHPRVRDDRIRQRLRASLVQKSQPVVIEAQLVQDGGVEVCDADSVLDGTVADFVGGSVDVAAFEATAGDDQAERIAVVISPGSIL